MFKKETGSITNMALVLILLFILFYILYIGASLIIPFIIAVLFSFAIIGLSDSYKKLRIPGFIAFILSLATYSGIFWVIGKMIGSNIDEIIKLLPEYQREVTIIIGDTLKFFHIPEPTSVTQVLEQVNVQSLFTVVVGGVTSIFSSAGLILFYVLFILLESRYFRDKVNLMIGTSSQKTQILETMGKIKSDVKLYFVIKTFVSFCTALFSYIIMMAFGLDFAVFWSMLIFILNFIPNVGSIIAVTFPSLLSLVQPSFSLYDSAIMITGLASIQILMGNIVEPRFMGNRLNLSPLVIIIALGFWGTLWGIIGMLLSVPIMVIINIILAKIPATRPIAILLSEKGDLQVDGGEEVKKEREKLFVSIKEKVKGKSKHKKKK